MEALFDSEELHYSQTASVQDQFHNLIVKTMQQSGPIVVVLDALDECSADDNEDGRGTFGDRCRLGPIYLEGLSLWSPVETFLTFVMSWWRSAIPYA